MQIKDERGTSLIEFAIVLTILLALTFGMIDFGRYVYTISVVRAAAQEGARAGISEAVDAVAAAAIAKDKMIGLEQDHVVVDVQKGNEIVNATVTYEFEFITPLGGFASLLGSPKEGAFSTVVITGTASAATLQYFSVDN